MSNSAPIRIFHLSDIHFGLEDREALAWAREASRASDRTRWPSPAT
jgi:hypothetical protein